MTKLIMFCVHHVYHPKQDLHGELTARKHRWPLCWMSYSFLNESTGLARAVVNVF